MVVVSAAPPPAPAAPPAIRRRQHPPYKEMILRAVEALKERKGSSRRAISKFIASNYGDLPPTHDALLSLHLRRLRTSGLLVMSKHSYKLPPSSASDLADAPPRRPRGRPSRKNTAMALESSSGGKEQTPHPLREPAPTATPSSSKRRPGRPPKSAPLPPPAAATVVPKRGPGRPPKAAEVLLSMRFSGETWNPVQPPKLDSVAAMKPKLGRPPKPPSPSINDAGKKRKPGRPPKAVSLQTNVGKGKRKPGRPPRAAATEDNRKPDGPTKAATLPANAADGKRKAGRPPKGSTESGRKLKPPILNEARQGRAPNESIPRSRAALVMKGKPGRPAKVLLDASLLGEQLPGSSQNDVGPSKGKLPALPPGKRRPGRPKKEFGSMTKEPPIKKLKPGRPAKHAAVVSEPGNAETRKPGRPKKAPSLQPVVKKRGRPPKVKDTAQPTLENGNNELPL